MDRIALWRVLALLLAAATLAGGCATANDPSFNPYARPRSGATLLEHADRLMHRAERALDNLDRRIENGVY